MEEIKKKSPKVDLCLQKNNKIKIKPKRRN